MDNLQSQRHGVVFPPPLERSTPPGVFPLLPVSLPLLGRPHQRRRGRRAGFLVRLRWLWREGDIQDLRLPTSSRHIRLRLVGTGLVSLLPHVYHLGCHLKAWKPAAQRGRNPVLLRSLLRRTDSVPGASASAYDPEAPAVKMMVINARSVANKAHILNDLFCSEKLDFMFISETWQRENEVSHLLELSWRLFIFQHTTDLWPWRIIIVGDFNIHAEDPSNATTKEFLSIMDS
ncbi:hypothetical protein MHYP_G00019070 [Metynnis hypsauchen]